MTIAEIKEMISKACTKEGVTLKVPVEVNGRLSRTLGRVMSYKYSNGRFEPYKIEISKKLLDNASDAEIRDVVLHETAHYVILEKTHEDHNHDSMFQQTCLRLGTDNYRPEFKITIPMPYKYIVTCGNCGIIAGRYDRRGKVIKDILAGGHNYQCRNCKSVNLIVKENK